MVEQKRPLPDDDDEVSWEDAFAEAAQGQGSEEEAEQELAPVVPDSVSLPPSPSGGVDIDFLLDISLNVTVEVGRKKIPISDLLQMQQGSVITLEKMLGEPFEVYVNGKLMAFGEIVVVNEKFGVRLTDVIDPKERIEKLG